MASGCPFLFCRRCRRDCRFLLAQPPIHFRQCRLMALRLCGPQFPAGCPNPHAAVGLQFFLFGELCDLLTGEIARCRAVIGLHSGAASNSRSALRAASCAASNSNCTFLLAVPPLL